MRQRVQTLFTPLLALFFVTSVGLVVGCSDDETSGSGKCSEGQVYDSDLEQCVDEGSGSASGGTAGDTYAGGGDGSATGGGSGGDADAGPYADGVCKKRSKYLQVYKPNVYFTVDTSDSMTGEKWTQAKSGLDDVADSIGGELRVGLSAYPQPTAGCSSREFLDLSKHPADKIKESYASIEPAGGTPTGIALYQVRQGGWLEDSGDKYDQHRPKALILITDGQPNDEEVCDQNVKDPVEQAKKLASNGVSVYVVGFRSEADPKTLDKLAEAGGTDAPGSNRFYSASNGQELASALLEITGTSVSCSFSLNPKPPQGSSVNMTLDGESVPESGYEYNESSGRVELTGSWCDKVQEQSQEGTTLNIDIGCPDCALAGESCETSDDCCDGSCEDGVCVEECREIGETCTSDSECCAATCASSESDDLLGECIGG